MRIARRLLPGAALLSMIGALAPLPLSANVLQCVPYARQISGIDIRGDAWTWWQQAAGLYARGTEPRPGAVMALANTDVMPLGHVAVVSRVLDERHILLRHANWSAPGLIEEDVLAVDSSLANDWSQVRVWWGQTQQMGARDNPVYGFIYPERIADNRMAKGPQLKLDASLFREVTDTGVSSGRPLTQLAVIIQQVQREAGRLP